MYSFSSASHTCDPLPRTMNGGSPPTERKARTGEFTPPGIMDSARCCKRRDCSVLREVVVGINSSRQGENGCHGISFIVANLGQPLTIAARANSSDIHQSAIALQHPTSILSSSKWPF